MQTFLPDANYQYCASVLDRQRLGKQRVEAWQILRTITGEGPQGWANHPAVKMWRGHEGHLALYGAMMCREWLQRGYKDSLMPRFNRLMFHENADVPAWIGDAALHRSHRSNLVRKLPEHYGALWPDVTPDLPYVWPIR